MSYEVFLSGMPIEGICFEKPFLLWDTQVLGPFEGKSIFVDRDKDQQIFRVQWKDRGNIYVAIRGEPHYEISVYSEYSNEDNSTPYCVYTTKTYMGVL